MPDAPPRRRLSSPPLQRRRKCGQSSALRQFGVGSVAYLLIIALSFASPPTALVAHFAVAVFYIADRTAARA